MDIKFILTFNLGNLSFLIKDKYILKNGETALYLTYKELDELFGKANYFEDENVEEIVDP